MKTNTRLGGILAVIAAIIGIVGHIVLFMAWYEIGMQAESAEPGCEILLKTIHPLLADFGILAGMSLVFGVISLATFLLLELVPGDAATALLGDGASTEDYQLLREKLGLDQPVYVRYARWAGSMLRGDFGTSLVSRYPVAHLYLQRLPYTIQLTLCGLLFAVVTAVPAGIFAALRPGLHRPDLWRLRQNHAAPGLAVGLVGNRGEVIVRGLEVRFAPGTNRFLTRFPRSAGRC